MHQVELSSGRLSIFNMIKVPISAKCMKRTVLSSIAQIFDPLGLPVVVTAKILIQELWKLQLDWDESLPADILAKWLGFVAGMQHLNNFCVSRQSLMAAQAQRSNCMGFAMPVRSVGIAMEYGA